jgi:hypothetical protein
MTLDEFEIQVISACDASPIVVGVAVIGSGVTWVRLRAYLTDESFIEAFFNEATQKIAFARIQEGSLVFSADNTGGWHWHPIGTPDEHIRTGEAVSFSLFLQRVEKDLKVKGQ